MLKERKWRPNRLRIQSFWIPKIRNKDLVVPDPSLREEWEAERDWRLILLRFKWGHKTYELIVNKDDELELRKTNLLWTTNQSDDKDKTPSPELRKHLVDFGWGLARKKPIEILFREPIPNGSSFKYSEPFPAEIIKTREGEIVAFPGEDYIIKGVEGELYPIKKEIFKKTYEVLEPIKRGD